MATHVADTLGKIDAAIGGYAEAVFLNLAGPITTTCQIMGLVGLAFMALNTLTQWVPIRIGSYLVWGVRFVVITAVATSWAQFQPIYEIVTNVPADIGGNFLAAAGIGDADNLYDGLDLMITELFEFSDRAADESAFYSISLASIVIWIAGALMACAAILVASLGKVGLAMAVSLAPVFIPTLMFRATGNLFESWVRFTIGFALIPLVLGGVIGTVLGIGQALATTADGASQLSDAAGFIIVAAAAIFLMAQVPTLVNGLSGSIVATANGFREARQGMDLMKSAGRPGVAGAKFVGRYGGPRVTQAAGAASAGLSSKEERGGNTRWRATLQNWKETQAARKQGAQDIGATNAKFGRQTSWSDRRQAARAAGAEHARGQMRGSSNSPSAPSGGSSARQRPRVRKSWEKDDAYMGPWGPGAKK